MGEIPSRSALQQRGLEKPLRPYLQIAQAVRLGDLAHFKQVRARGGRAEGARARTAGAGQAEGRRHSGRTCSRERGSVCTEAKERAGGGGCSARATPGAPSEQAQRRAQPAARTAVRISTSPARLAARRLPSALALRARQVMETSAAVFHADSTHTLIVRLRQNVIRAGLRNINLA